MRHGQGGGRFSRNLAPNKSSTPPDIAAKEAAATAPTLTDTENPYSALEDMDVEVKSIVKHQLLVMLNKMI